jgi:hypothetical protein
VKYPVFVVLVMLELEVHGLLEKEQITFEVLSTELQ